MTGPGPFGAVAVWSLDRLGRSAIDILQAVEAFEARGIRLYVVKDGLETSGTAGHLIVTVLLAWRRSSAT
jgi:DNA invertase Pin-like site-specific DNA recombinase